MAKKSVVLVCSLDVEEEGLFRERYSLGRPSLKNLACLDRLSPLISLGVRPTLFCAHPVFDDDAAWGFVERFKNQYPNTEIGAHLHHWNTPPISTEGTELASVPSCLLGKELFAQKLNSLLERGKDRLGRRPTSFRMGRWDLRKEHWEKLALAGIEADASVRPLHPTNKNGTRPDHLDAPKNPYLVESAGRKIFELPLTATPLLPFLPRAAKALGLLSSPFPPFESWGVLALLPVYHPLWAMKAVTSLAISRGAYVLSLTWHSSEMMAGGNPALPSDASIDRLMRRIEAYLRWLGTKYDISFMTLGELSKNKRSSLACIRSETGDWAPA